jgi:hypothetical protein
MSFLVPSVGKQTTLNYITGRVSNGALKLHLYTNNYTPQLSDTLSSYTECTTTGYSAITLTATNWSASTVSGVTTATYTSSPMPTFTLSAAVTVYGYYVTDSGGTNLILAELFAVPYAFSSSGGSIVISPTIGET